MMEVSTEFDIRLHICFLSPEKGLSEMFIVGKICGPNDRIKNLYEENKSV